MPNAVKQQMTFGGGVNAQAPAHLIGEDQVQTATNIDFSLWRGAARSRRGYNSTYAVTTYTHQNLFKSYWQSGDDHWSIYSYIGSAILRATTTNDTIGTFTEIGSAGAGSEYGKYFTHIYSASGPYYIKDDGTVTSDWIKQVPEAPTITINTDTGISISNGKLPTAEGTAITGTRTGTYTYGCDPVSGRVTLVTTASLNLATNGSYATDTIGVVYSSMGFTDPTNIYRISVDFAIDDVAISLSTNTNTITSTTTTTVITNGTSTITVVVSTNTIATSTGSSTITNTTTTTTTGTGTSTGSSTSTASSTTTTSFYETDITSGFANYWHAEYLPNNGSSIESALSLPDTLTGALQQVGSGTNGTAISADTVDTIQGLINTDQTTPITQITFNGGVLSNLAIPKTNFQLIGTSGTTTGSVSQWANITGVRYIFESYTVTQTALLGSCQLLGDEGHPLNDMNIGYTWYQTYAEIDTNGNFIGESAASPGAGPFMCQNANATVVTNGTITGSYGTAGYTHIITYRQGGYAQSPYAVATQSLGTATFTDTLSDIQELLNNTPMMINVMAPSQFPGDVNIMCPEAWYSRMWIASANVLYWSEPGRPDQFILTNYAQISDAGDQIAGISSWASGLVIVNKFSVYEMNGSVFEGANANYVIQKSGARKGSLAPYTIIKTPYGIPLVNYDGISMYQPGAGVELPLPWVTEQIGDMFRGFGAYDPASLNGSRVPAINDAISNASACYTEGKLYIALPTGTNTINDTVLILDFIHQKCFWYQYQVVNQGPAPIYSLIWDYQNNSIFAAGVGGLFQLENFVVEPVVIVGSGGGEGEGTNTATGPVPWSFRTRAWTTPTDSLVENLAVEYEGGPIQVTAIFDGTATATLGTIGTATNTNTAKTYGMLPMNAVVENNLVFGFEQVNIPETSTFQPSFAYYSAVYGITWDAFPHPPKVSFYQSDYDNNKYEGDKLWDVFFCDIGLLQNNAFTGYGSSTGTNTVNAIGTVTATTFIDGVAVMTNTIVGTDTTNQGRRIFDYSFPSETYGEVAYTIYTGNTNTSGVVTLFKLWDQHYQARNEPPKVTYWHTDWESLEENICDGWDVDINPNGTVYGTAFVDNVATTTYTFTGTKRQSFTVNFPVEKYGRTIYAEYNSASSNTFKHYKTWWHLRKEPDRWTSYVSERRSAEEQHFDNFECELNCLGNTVLTTAYVDNVAISTFTYSSTGSIARERFVSAFPAETYGKTVYAQYNSTGVFKWFHDQFNGTKEPDRVNFLQKILPPYPSEHYAKTWIVEINPLGTTTGTLYIEGAAVSTGVFTGTIREMYQVGIDDPSVITLQTATAIEARYGNVSSTGLFKHYRTEIESDPKPFGKPTWAISYKKVGGASQIDVARYWSIDIELPPDEDFALATVIWDIDQQPGFSTNTLTLTTAGRSYIDLVPFPPGGRGRIFQERVYITDDFGNPIAAKVWRSVMMEERVGVKGFSTIAIVGTPNTEQ